MGKLAQTMNQISFPWGGSSESKAARDEGIQRVSAHNEDWHIRALKELGQLCGSGKCMTGEDMKLWLVPRIGHPKHVNMWGALVRSANKADLIADTGIIRLCTTKKSHARRTPVWQFK